MKATLTFALAAATASAQTIFTTDNECWLGQGGEYTGSCRDVFYLTCDEYDVYANSACNIFVFSDNRLDWNSSMISVVYWAWNMENDYDKSLGKTSGTDFVDGGRCYGVEDIPTTYDKGTPINYTEGMCGFKFQATNEDEFYPNSFTLMKDSASTLMSGAAIILAASLAF